MARLVVRICGALLSQVTCILRLARDAEAPSSRAVGDSWLWCSACTRVPSACLYDMRIRCLAGLGMCATTQAGSSDETERCRARVTLSAGLMRPRASWRASSDSFALRGKLAGSASLAFAMPFIHRRELWRI